MQKLQKPLSQSSKENKINGLDKNLPLEKDYLECGLPIWLEESISAYEEGKESSIWDCLYCELQSDINVAEQEQLISSEQAWYLREKYLGISNRMEEL